MLLEADDAADHNLLCPTQHADRFKFKAVPRHAVPRSCTACASGKRAARLARTPPRGAWLVGSVRRAHRRLPLSTTLPAAGGQLRALCAARLARTPPRGAPLVGLGRRAHRRLPPSTRLRAAGGRLRALGCRQRRRAPQYTLRRRLRRRALPQALRGRHRRRAARGRTSSTAS